VSEHATYCDVNKGGVKEPLEDLGCQYRRRDVDVGLEYLARTKALKTKIRTQVSMPKNLRPNGWSKLSKFVVYGLDIPVVRSKVGLELGEVSALRGGGGVVGRRRDAERSGAGYTHGRVVAGGAAWRWC
jgi:hypothetical protein